MKKRKGFVLMLTAILITGLIAPAYAAQPVAVQAAADKMAVEKVSPQPEEVLPTPKISKEKAVEIATKTLKELFDMDVEDEKFTFNITNRRDWMDPDKYVWQLHWNYHDPMEYIYANVVVDAMTGDILEISQDQAKPGESAPKVTTLTKEEAKEKAEAFVEKMVPGLLKETKCVNNSDDYYRIMKGGSYPLYYHFNYVRMYNGVKYDANYINVGVDGATGEIRNFNYRWDQLKDLPSKEGIKTLEEAAQIIKDHIQMELVYLPIRDQAKYEPVPKKVKLAYKAAYNYADILDAKTGKMIGWNGKTQEQVMKVSDLTEKQIQDILKKAKPVKKKNQEITKERAQQLAIAVLKDEVEDTVKIKTINYIEGDGYWEAAGRKVWNVEFIIEKKAAEDGDNKQAMIPAANGRILIDALTEEVLAFNYWDHYAVPYGQSFEPAMTWEEAYAKAIDVIAKYHPNKIDQVKTEQVYISHSQKIDGKEMPPAEYHFNFVRKVNGVLYEENAINVSFNNRTGKLQNFSCRWQEDINFPSPEKVLTVEEAKNKLLQYHEVELAYARFNTSSDYQNPQFEIKLVYRLFPKKTYYHVHMLMDAFTGRAIDYNGKEMPMEEADHFEEAIKGHWVERTAKLLALQGILDQSTFKPDQPITKLEAVKMLVKAKGMDDYPMEKADEKLNFSDVKEDSDDSRYIYAAIRYGILENEEGPFNGSANISREELAVLIVKLLKYDALAKATHIFTLSFKDKEKISSDLKGYVAICQGLNLLREEHGAFRPKDQATMAETADMIYKALGYIQR